MDADVKAWMARLDLMNKEYDALEELQRSYKDITTTAVVDDDFPRVKAIYEGRLRDFLAACKANGRTM